MTRSNGSLRGQPSLPASGLLCGCATRFTAPLTLAQAVEAASKNYPSIRVSQEQMNAAAEGIRLARTAYLPRVDALAQVNRATRNNVFGLLLPQNVIPVHLRTGHRDPTIPAPCGAAHWALWRPGSHSISVCGRPT